MKPHHIPSTLPEPSPEAQQQSARLKDLIREEIRRAGGRLRFDQFMAQALYRLGLGYYAQAGQIFGEGGDFITAPELSPLFGRCLARQARQVLQELGGGELVEFGAGSGVLAETLLRELEALDCLPERYTIVDVSPSLVQRQQERLRQNLPHLFPRIQWRESCPQGFRGMVVGNEVLDALPVHKVRFRHDGRHEELFVADEAGRLVWAAGEPSSPQLKQVLEEIYRQHGEGMVDGYESEVNLAAERWLENLAGAMEQGVVILIDYGFPRHEFYHPERHQGTLMCHYQHHVHPDPLILPGLQDVTSHVDFTAIAESALACGLQLEGFTSQAYFLIACGIEQMLAELEPESLDFLRQAQAVKKLLMPHEMGELFKVIGLSKGFSSPLLGFSLLDQRGRL